MRNAKAALLAAIEIYNKPRFDYRDECVVILLLNAWELLLKALLSKNKVSVFYPKKRGQPYRTLSWDDALTRAQTYFPKDVSSLPVRKNLDILSTYRDNSVHFYNSGDFRSVIHALAQTNIVNFKDLLKSSFGVDLGDEITWRLLPLGLKPPIDPIEYMSKRSQAGDRKDPAVRQFILELRAAAREVEEAGADTGRLMTAFTVKLESTKKIERADIVVGVEKTGTGSGPLAVYKTIDPNISHPLQQRDLVQKIGTIHERKFTTYVFQAVVWKHQLKSNQRYCWQATGGILTKYSNDVVPLIRELSEADVEAALKDYAAHLKARANTAQPR
jgi:hypothetical protein